MNVWRQKLTRLLLSAAVFWMALVLTPRAWVDRPSSARSAEVPVRALDQPDDCLWCDPSPAIRPANCTDQDDDDSLWLNPDQVGQPDSAPCLDRDPDDKPSA